jgi:radical SAM superfamily enzyme YgiQ (UPF0313 family)
MSTSNLVQIDLGEATSEARHPVKVLLINPPRFNELIGKNPAIVEKHRGFNPPLGILSLAGYLEKHTSHDVDVIDCQPPGWTYDELRDQLAQRTFEVVGITAMTFTLIDVIATCKVIRQVKPSAKIVLGGPHVHLYPDETIRMPEVDFLIQGEGEIAFQKFLANYQDPSTYSSIPGLVYHDADGRVQNNGISPITTDLDLLGWPARHKLDSNMYQSLLGRANKITTMFTSRGCPFKCTFCDRPFSPTISGFRFRSAKHVADEIEEIIELGVEEAFIYDDTFSVSRKRVYELCDEIKQRKLKFTWDVRAHVNTVTADLLRAMADAGCDRIHYGVEVGNDRMMKTIRKNTTVEKVKQAFAWTKQAEMETLAYFIVGQQTEVASDIDDSIRLAKELDPNYCHFTVFCPYPGTQIYMEGLEKGIIKEDVWRKFSENPRAGYELPVWEENFSRDELRELLVKCYKSFYLRPRFVWRAARRIRGFGELSRMSR